MTPFSQGVAKRFILATYDSHGQTVDHVFIDCTFTDSTGAGGDKNLDATSLCILEEQLRTSTLKTMLLDGKLATYQSGKVAFQYFLYIVILLHRLDMGASFAMYSHWKRRAAL